MAISTDVVFQNGYYGRLHYNAKQGTQTFEGCGREIILQDIFYNLEDKKYSLLLKWEYQGHNRYKQILRNEVSEIRTVKELLDDGADITPRHFSVFVDSVRIQEEERYQQGIQPTYTYRNLGWIWVPEFDIGGNIIGHQLCYRDKKLIGANSNANYIGDWDVEVCGDPNLWHKMVREEVLGRPVLELVLVASLSAVTNALLLERIPTENPIVHLNCGSGKGKTTVAMLATSPYGKAYDGSKSVTDKFGQRVMKRSLYQSWSATDNALIQRLSGNCGAVTVLNELGKYLGNDATRLIFEFSEGSNRDRLNKEFASNLSERFSTVFISTGESSLLEKCKKQYEGLRIRVMEITDELTESAEHSNRIKEASINNCGYAAPIFAKYLINNNGINLVYSTYKKWLDELKSEISDNYNAERFVEKYAALFLMTAELASTALNLKFDLEAIKNYLLDYDKKNGRKRNAALESYDIIIEECRVNSHKFWHKGSTDRSLQPSCNSTECWGRICNTYHELAENKVVIKEYEVRPKIVKKILKDNGFENLNTCISAWKEAKLLDHEKGHNYRKRIINAATGEKENVYVFRVFADEEELAEIKKEQAKTTIRKRVVDISKKELLEEEEMAVNE